MVEDINYLAQQSSGRINMILSGMMALMSDTDSKVSMLESQKWFQRMVKTVFGKNKLTQAEIQQDHDKLNAYVSEAIAELYSRNCIDHKVMMSLGTQLNEIYANNLQLKQMLGSFISKLNEKIDRIDNFHMLITEIDQGVYSKNSPIISICMVISQLDKKILKDGKKLEIIRRSLMTQQILNEQEELLTDYLMNILQMPIDEVGQIYLELRTISDNFMASIILKMMDKYYFLPDIARKVKNKEMLVQEVIQEEGLDDTVTLSVSEIYDDFINSKIDTQTFLISNSQIQVEASLEQAEKLFLDCKLDEAFELFKALAEQGNARAMYFMGEYYIHQYGHVKEDNEMGDRWRKKGYELGDVLCSLNIAYSFPKDSPERNELIDKMFKPTLQLAESGDVFAQNEISDLYLIGYIEETDEEKKLYWLKKSAEAGYWRSMYKLGKWLQYNEEYSEAIKWYHEAAEKGYAKAENQLGSCYFNGIGVEVNEYEAFKWGKKSAEHGLALGQYNLASCYEYGDGVEQDLEKAKEWYKKAFENGYDEAGTSLGVLLEKTEDYKEAIEWYKKSAEREDAQAENRLALCYDEGKGVEVDKYEAFKWYKKSAEHGDCVSQGYLAYFYQCGKGTKKDVEKAKEWYEKAFENGCDWAGTYLGLLLEEAGDYKEAIEWYKKSAEREDEKAENQLGLCYDEGKGVEVDKYEAFKWYKKSAEHGLAVGQNNLAYCYEYGEGVKQDLYKAKEWYKKAFENGYDNAGTNLGVLLEEAGDYKEAIEWYKKSAEREEAEAENYLGLCYDTGKGVEVDKYEAFKWFKKSAEHGLAVGQNNLAYCYRYGEGVKQDFEKAKKWYKKAFENGYDEAGTSLGLLLEEAGDYKEAIEWYKKLAEHGLAVGQNNLACCYEYVEDVKQDLEKAKKWYEKAFENGYDEAGTSLGLLLEEAQKLFLDYKLEEAFDLFKYLAEKGNSRAMYFMGEYYTHQYGNVTRDIEEGKRWRQKAYELGDVLGALNVAYSFPKDSPEGNKIIYKIFQSLLSLAENGDIFAQDEIADLYGGLYRLATDREKQLYWLRKAAEGGYWRSMNALGTLLEANEKYSEAIEWYHKSAEKGYDVSQFNIGVLYIVGDVVEQDYEKGVYWIKKSVENKNAIAQNYLGFCYDNGIGVEENKYEAFKWYKKSAEQGLAIGQNNLAYCYEVGEGTEKNLSKAKGWYINAFENGMDEAGTRLGILAQEAGYHKEAVRWYQQAAENGNADAQNYLGMRYHDGKGVSQDEKMAFELFMKAAKQGHRVAQYNVWYYYYNGFGTAKDNKKARDWLRKSAEQGYDTAKNELRHLYEEVTSKVDVLYLNDSLAISQNTYEAINTACKTFIKLHGGSQYNGNYKLKSVFHILDENVYLAHDDTLFQNGKNGFAITECGLYCRSFMDIYTTYISFRALAYAHSIYIKSSYIYADDNMIAYICGISAQEREDLRSLFEQIAMLVKMDLC